MDGKELILTEAISPPLPLQSSTNAALRRIAASRQSGQNQPFSEEQKKQIAKDFESVLLTRLLNEMKETIGDGGFEADGASKQVQGLFWLYLARDIADKGGLGLWKDIYKWLDQSKPTKTTVQSQDQGV